MCRRCFSPLSLFVSRVRGNDPLGCPGTLYSTSPSHLPSIFRFAAGDHGRSTLRFPSLLPASARLGDAHRLITTLNRTQRLTSRSGLKRSGIPLLRYNPEDGFNIIHNAAPGHLQATIQPKRACIKSRHVPDPIIPIKCKKKQS